MENKQKQFDMLLFSGLHVIIEKSGTLLSLLPILEGRIHIKCISRIDERDNRLTLGEFIFCLMMADVKDIHGYFDNCLRENHPQHIV